MRLTPSKVFCFSIMAVFLTGCGLHSPFKAKESASRKVAPSPADPANNYPGWASDAPQYSRPVQELAPEPKAKPGDPLHYFTREKLVMIRQPSGYTPEQIPRVAIWWTDNNGFQWHKAGVFGREQAFFPFEVEDDGDYGIRFVGPGQEQAAAAPAFPERVYHVDTVLPSAEVVIEPEQSWYNPGQDITIAWRSDDYHLIETPVNISALMDFTADESKPIEVQKNLAKEGTITYQIPSEALDHEIRFRIDALDRAGNLGIAYSHALQVSSDPIEQSPAKQSKKGSVASRAQKPREEAVTLEVSPVVEAPVQSKDDEELQIRSDYLAALTEEAKQRSAGLEDAPPPTAEFRVMSTGETDTASGKPLETAEVERPRPAARRRPSEPRKAETALRSGAKDNLTQGNQLLIPLPATVEPQSSDPKWALARPWRILARNLERQIMTVWTLPRARFLEMNPMLKGLFIAEKSTKPVAEPARSDSHVAELSDEKSPPELAP